MIRSQGKKNVPLPEKRKAKPVCIALAGNPNCGKTTLFNQLTGSHQYVGNWPGVTVERKEGVIKGEQNGLRLLDLPGVYSLSPYSPEEMVTRHCLIQEIPDVILNIIDATNLERNLYLTTQLMELGRPLVIALNMMDLLKQQGLSIDVSRLQKELQVPVIPISASRGTGIKRLIEACQACFTGNQAPFLSFYHSNVELAVTEIQSAISSNRQARRVGTRWLAIKLLEGDEPTQAMLTLTQEQIQRLQKSRNRMAVTQYRDRPMMIADERYQYICGLCSRVVQKSLMKKKATATQWIDRIVTNKILAIPIFLMLLFFLFGLTFGPVGNGLKELLEGLIKEKLGGAIAAGLVQVNVSPWLYSMIMDGMVEGVGSVLSFAPQIMLLFTLLSLLEDSGYMARAAFIMDRLLRKIGLSGRAFVPMIMGFGCTVPAVLGTRTLESRKDQQLTILITPFLSCSAKMPVYALFVSVFFPHHKALVIFSIYLLGIIIAILTALLFKNTLLKGEAAPFVMELPPYRMPALKTLWMHVWQRLKDFLIRAGTLILLASMVIWFLQSFDMNLHLVEDSAQSILAVIGTVIAPAFTLCGFSDWRASVSLLTGLVAKESVVSSMAVLFAGTGTMISQVFTPLSAYCFLVFVLLYPPCIGALSAIRKEMKSAKWTVVSIGYQLVVAWFVSSFLYQFGTLVGNLLP